LSDVVVRCDRSWFKSQAPPLPGPLLLPSSGGEGDQSMFRLGSKRVSTEQQECLPHEILAKAPPHSTFAGMEQLKQYIPVLMLGALAIVFSFGMLFFSVLVGKKGRRSAIKDTA